MYKIKSLIILLITILVLPIMAEEYHRGKFRHWVDLDYDGENAREETLIFDKFKNKNKDVWICPYTGKIITNPSELDIDHIVPLKWAWYHGADKWTDEKRMLFANDGANLLAVHGPSNRSKRDRIPTVWIPPNINYCITYIEKFEYICDIYELPYNKTEFNKVKDFCKKMEKGFRLDKIRSK